MKEVIANENDRVVLIKRNDNYEIATNLEDIIEASLELCRTFFPKSNPEIVILEKDVYEHYSMLNNDEQYKIINKLLRNYFSVKEQDN